MNKLFCVALIGSILLTSNYGYEGSTTSAVTLVGGIIKAKHIDKEKKYPRKNCPVCKGTGKYLSGDGIKMVDCGYCEPEKADMPAETSLNNEKKKSPFCRCENCQCENCQCKPKNVIVIQK
jgi:hypothetical protein